MSGVEVVKYIELGKRLPKPEKAEFEVFNIMQNCWEKDPKLRPQFSELFNFFVESPEYANLKELLKTQDLEKLNLN